MKIRKMVKRTLTVGMLVLMACTSMSAMAEPTWVFVADVVPGSRSVDSDDKGFDKICEYYAREQSNSSWPVIFDGTYDLTLLKDHGYIALICFGEDHLNNRDWFPAKFSCPWNLEGTEILGTFSLDRPDGCYEFKEPDCIPLPVPLSGSLCKEEPPKAPDGTPLGAAVVACDGTTMQLCLWEKYQGDAQDPQAIAFINRSTFVHEDFHRNDPNLFCITEGDYAGYVGSDKDSEAGYLSDINAYSTQWDYLERVKAQCCTSSMF